MTLASLNSSFFFTKIFPNEKGANAFILFLVFFLFAFVEGIGMFHHEMWRDELEPWLVASCSDTLSDFFQNMRMGSNPYIWYIILHFLSKVSLEPVVVQIAHFLFSVVAVYLFLRFSPFTILQKILFCFGYYTLYEYGIISRGYALTIFFLFLFCSLYKKYWATGIPLALVIFLFANATGGFGVILSISLLIFFIANYVFGEMDNSYQKLKAGYWVGSVMIIIFSIGFALNTMFPPADSVYASAWFTQFNSTRFAYVLWRIWYGFVPIPQLSGIQFWNTNMVQLGDAHPFAKYYITFFSLLFLGINTLILSRKLSVLMFYLSGTIGILLFSYLQESIFFSNASRYHGFLFLIFIVSLWLTDSFPEKKSISIPLLTGLSEKLKVYKLKKYFLLFYLAANVLACMAAYYKDYKYSFSAVEKAGKFILANKLEKYPASGYIDCTVAPITAYIRRPMYYPDRDTISTFPIWTSHNHTTVKSNMLNRLINYISKKDSVLVVLNSELDTAGITNVYFTRLAVFDKSIVSDENIYIYMAKH